MSSHLWAWLLWYYLWDPFIDLVKPMATSEGIKTLEIWSDLLFRFFIFFNGDSILSIENNHTSLKFTVYSI